MRYQILEYAGVALLVTGLGLMDVRWGMLALGLYLFVSGVLLGGDADGD